MEPDQFLESSEPTTADTDPINEIRTVHPDTLNMRHLANAFSVQYVPPARPRRKSFLKTFGWLLIVLLLAGGALAIYCVLDPGFYEQMQMWGRQKLNALDQWIAPASLPARPSTRN